MKKVLALVLAFAMVFSTVSFAFADTTAPAAELSAEAKACAELGMLQGANGTVDAAYTATEPTRIQAAIMLLRLKGLEAAAKEFTGTDNFADVKADNWAAPITAYLKANPELGFIGDGKNFNAGAKMDAKSYAKVLLTALGYKQTSADVVGDYTWEGVVEFAKSKGLAKAESETFTIDDLAKATVEALKVNAKDSAVTLAASLVDAGKVDKAKAVELGLYVVEQVNIKEDKVAPKVTKAESTDTNTVEVTFNKPVEKASAANKDNYTVKRSSTSLTIKSIEVKGNKVVLTTEGMENSKTYTITVQNVKNLSGVAMTEKYTDTFTGTVDKKAPTLDDVYTKTNIRFNAVFSEELDKASAENVANYKITSSKGDLAIKSVKLIENVDENDNDDMDTVEFITEPQKSGTKYTLHVVNVCDDSVSLNKIVKEDTEEFSGKAKSTTKPDVETSSTYTKTLSSTKVIVGFKANGSVRLDFESATNVANYSFNNDLDVESVEMLDATDADCHDVIITTSTQDDDKTYSVTIKNVEDELGNVMDSRKVSVGKGKTDDNSGPAIAKIVATDTDEVVVYFTEKLDPVSAQDINNYDFDTLGVEKAVLESDRQRVTITTAGEMENIYYTVNIKGIKDLNGNEMAEETEGINQATFVGYLDEDTLDIEHPEVDFIDVESRTEVRIGFTEKVRVNPATAAGYTSWLKPYCEGYGQPVVLFKEVNSSGDFIGNPIPATFVGGWYTYGKGVAGYSEDGKELELTVADGALATNKTYRPWKIQNVTDWAGNGIPQKWVDDNGDDFDLSGSDSYSDMAEFESIDQVRADRIDIKYSRPVKLVGGNNPAGGYYTQKTIDGYTVEVRPADPTVVRVSKSGGIPEKDFEFDFSDDLQSLQGYWALDENDESSDTNGISKNGKTEFTSNDEDEDKPVIEEVVAIDSTTIKVVFDKSVTAGTFKLTEKDGDKKSYPAVVKDGYNSGGNTMYLLLTNDTLDVDNDYTLTVSNVKDRSGNVMKTEDVDFDANEQTTNASYIAGMQLLSGTKANLFISKDVLKNYNNEGQTVNNVAVKFAGTTITYNVPTGVESLIQYNRGDLVTDQLEDSITDDVIFDLYAFDETYVKRDNSVNDAALVCNNVYLPAFFAGATYTVDFNGALPDYEFEIAADDGNMDGGITAALNGGKLDVNFDDFDADQNVIVRVFKLTNGNFTHVDTATPASGSYTTTYNNFAAGDDVVVTVERNGNIIHAKGIADIQ